MNNINDIADIQKDVITKYIIDRANGSNEVLDMEYLSRILQEDKVSDRLGYPFFSRETNLGDRPDRKIDFNQNINIDAFNDNLATIKADVDTIRDTIRLSSNRIDSVKRTVNRIIPLITDAKNKVNDKYKELRVQMGIFRFAYRETVADTVGFDLQNTTSFLDTDRGLIQSQNAGSISAANFIGVLTSETLQAVAGISGDIVATDSNFYHMFVPGADKKTYIRITKDKREETDVKIAAFLQDIPIKANTIIINAEHSVPTRTTIEIESKGKTTIILQDEYLTDAIYTYRFDRTEVDRVNIYMWQKIETFVKDDNFAYIYGINNISLRNINFTEDSLFITSPITTPFPITDVMMDTVENRPVGTNIKYSISKDKEKWIPITPRNISENSPNTLVNLGLSSTEQVDGIGNHSVYWSKLTPINSFGVIPLFNVLEHSSGSFIDDDYKLNIASDSENDIIEDSIRVYRGYDDWSINEQNYEVTEEYSKVEYRFEPYSLPVEEGQFVKPSGNNYNYDIVSTIPIVRIDTEGHRVYNDAGIRKIKTKYPINNNNLTVINLKTNRKIDLNSEVSEPIDYAGGIICLNDNDVIVGEDIIVTYHTTINDMEEVDNVTIDLDTTSVKYSSSGDISALDRDGSEVYYSTLDKRMYLTRDNTLDVNNIGWTTVYVSFKLIKKSRDKYKVFKTYVYYSQDTEIDIFPFTQEELSAGNFHTIDGVDISSKTSHFMTGGLHEVVTTQPMKTDPSNPKDINVLTNKRSNAGIALGDYDERRAFEKSMRKVSNYTLSNVINPGDHRSFAYDNGKIYINFTPEQLSDTTLIVASHITGEEIAAKDVVYLEDGYNSFYSYTNKKETFLIEYKTAPKDPNDELKTMYVRGELQINKDNGISPSIFQFDVLFL
jgi:hypothetical protein